ncbi:MAG: hypothetical protein C5B59_12185 [Bacteroidetes bacterium]|nr:MAG: hypothetical protein C5B59_12185 [Bacteroidota bacterium]
MNSKYIQGSIFFTGILALLAFFSAEKNSPKTKSRSEREYIPCAPPASENITANEYGRFAPIFPGWGHHSYTITTGMDSAQFFFNQGLTMYYSYHAKEAVASFKEAARLDPQSAMAYWGQALAMGPNYNFAHYYKMKPWVPEIVENMKKNAGTASAKEKDLIAAMSERYSTDSTNKDRESLNAAYAKSMHALVSKYPEDLDIKALYVDAVMLQHVWDFWHNDGKPQGWTPELVSLCENILAKNPEHPGALHYYIHVTEASRHPEKALKSADILRQLLPGVAHMVHMSSHVYERTGLYAEGVQVNDKADDDLVMYETIGRQLALGKHATHYFAVQSFCAISGGIYKEGLQKATRCRNSVTPTYEDADGQYTFMMPVFAKVRMGKWKEILNEETEPDRNWVYASLLSDFANGLAQLRMNNIPQAKRRLDSLRYKMKDTILKVRDIPFNSAYQGAYIAERILNASILFDEGKSKEAILQFEDGIKMEDSLIYSEPRDWILPCRQYLGAVLLKLKRPEEAEKVYRDDLLFTPGNGWSLLGLYQSLVAQHKNEEARQYRALYEKAFAAADELPKASVY